MERLYRRPIRPINDDNHLDGLESLRQCAMNCPAYQIRTVYCGNHDRYQRRYLSHPTSYSSFRLCTRITIPFFGRKVILGSGTIVCPETSDNLNRCAMEA